MCVCVCVGGGGGAYTMPTQTLTKCIPLQHQMDVTCLARRIWRKEKVGNSATGMIVMATRHCMVWQASSL